MNILLDQNSKSNNSFINDFYVLGFFLKFEKKLIDLGVLEKAKPFNLKLKSSKKSMCMRQYFIWKYSKDIRKLFRRRGKTFVHSLRGIGGGSENERSDSKFRYLEKQNNVCSPLIEIMGGCHIRSEDMRRENVSRKTYREINIFNWSADRVAAIFSENNPHLDFG